MLIRPVAAVSLLSLTLGSVASAAPFLGTTASFMTSAFCKAHSCKHVATVPTSVAAHFEQFHYDVDKKYRVVVWRITSDKTKLSPSTLMAGQVRAVGIEWYGLQDTPFGAENFVAQLMTFATGKSTTAATALKLMGEGAAEQVIWGNYHIFRENRVLPSMNAGWMSVTAMMDPFK